MASTLPRKRSDLAVAVCELIGPAIVELLDRSSGWPAIVRVLTSTGPQLVAFHIGPIGTHSREVYERRFQNPDNHSLPVAAPSGSVPILVGISWAPSPILVAVDGRSRLGQSTRFSLLFNERVLNEAATSGWSEYISSTGERFLGMRPELFPIAVELLASGLTPSASALSTAVVASGLLTSSSAEAAERARRATSVLVRNAKFSQTVRKAYNSKCAMCGLGIDLVEGAHILPVSAIGSTDDVWNGIALCRNHHRAFDMHRIYIDPDNFNIRMHPSLLSIAHSDPVVRRFREGTLPTLATPSKVADRPRPKMIRDRISIFRTEYAWV
jgi:hypothetical protein